MIEHDINNCLNFAGTPGLGIWDDANNQRSWLIYQNSSSLPRFYVSTNGTGGVAINAAAPTITTNQWNHFCMERNGSTLFGYVNGVCVGVNTTLGTQSIFTPADPFLIGKWSASYYIDGEIQDLRVYKGVAKYKGGFDLPKPYTPVGIGTWRAVSDTCTNNFATLNPLQSVDNPNYASDNTTTLSNGNLTATKTSASSNEPIPGTIAFPVNGKFYYEMYLEEFASTGPKIGVCLTDAIVPSSYGYSIVAGGIYITVYTTTVNLGADTNTNGSGTTTNLSSTQVSAGDIVSVAVDLTSTRRITFYINGTEVGYAENFDETEFVSVIQSEGGNNSYTAHWNFGQNPTFSGTLTAGTNADANGRGLFKYAPPTGFLALCEDNLPTPAIADPGDYFKTVLYTGDGNVSREITGVGFAPDFVWLKSRTSANNHQLLDSVRGWYNLSSNNTNTEGTNPAIDGSSNGFSHLNGASNNFNGSGNNYVAWCWKAGGAAVANTDGTITSQVSANQDAGFSIVSYTGNGTNATVGHGLNKTPKFIITKNRDASVNWIIYHGSVGATQYLRFTTDAATTQSSIFNDTEPTSSVFSLGSSTTPNGNGQKQIAYCWAEIEGYSKFGSYVGNGSTDGPFVYCGFKPAWVMVKCSSAGSRNWRIWDSSRGSTNPTNLDLLADTSTIENNNAFDEIDLLSNGFKLRSTGSYHNSSGETYIFMAFAESPFQTANAK